MFMRLSIAFFISIVLSLQALWVLAAAIALLVGGGEAFDAPGEVSAGS